MIFEVRAKNKNGLELSLCRKFTQQSAEERQEYERERGCWEKVWIQRVING